MFDIVCDRAMSEVWICNWLQSLFKQVVTVGNCKIAMKLMDAGIDANALNALHAAVRGGHENLVYLMLLRGVSLSKKDQGEQPIHLAAHLGYERIVTLLLQRGANMNALNEKGYTPLQLAVDQGHLPVVNSLLDAGVDVNATSMYVDPALWIAVSKGHANIVRALIRHGANISLRLRATNILHHCALRAHNATVVDALVEAGVDIEARDTGNCAVAGGASPLSIACALANYEIALGLLRNGANIESRREDDATPLIAASWNRHSTVMIDLLLKWGADETAVDKDGKTALDIIEAYGDREGLAIRLLRNAPKDRAWRSRGFLIMCRVFPERLRIGKKSSEAVKEMTLGKLLYSYAERCHDDNENVRRDSRKDLTVSSVSSRVCPMGKRNATVCWIGVMARVLGIKEEGLFRHIVIFL